MILGAEGWDALFGEGFFKIGGDGGQFERGDGDEEPWIFAEGFQDLPKIVFVVGAEEDLAARFERVSQIFGEFWRNQTTLPVLLFWPRVGEVNVTGADGFWRQ